MQATRRGRLESVIIEELSVVVPREVKDPRIPIITFSCVQLTEDASMATIFFSILGRSDVDETELQECLDGLQSATGFLRRHLKKVLTIKHVPELRFKFDRGFENADRVNALLRKIEEENTRKNG